MSVIYCLILILWSPAEDTYTVTLRYQKHICAECKSWLSAALEKLPGKKSVTIGAESTEVVIEEGTKFDLGRFKAAVPRDMKLTAVVLRVRGKVAETSGRMQITLKGSGQVIELRNPERKDPLSELRKQLGGENKFSVEGAALESTKLQLATFEKTSYEDK